MPRVERSWLPLLPERGKISAFEIALLALCVGLIAAELPQSLRDVMLLTYLWGGLALAWNIAGGYAGLISFGHAAFFGIGAYTSTILSVNYEITPWIGIWVGAAISGVFGALLTLICARLRGPFFILSTLAASEVVRIGALNWATLTGGPEGLAIRPVPSVLNMVFASKTTYAILMLGYLVAIYLITKVIEVALRLLLGCNPRRRGRGQFRRYQSVVHARERDVPQRRAYQHRRLTVRAVFSLS
jgi:branched-chain amino acid transport system permease protein